MKFILPKSCVVFQRGVGDLAATPVTPLIGRADWLIWLAKGVSPFSLTFHVCLSLPKLWLGRRRRLSRIDKDSFASPVQGIGVAESSCAPCQNPKQALSDLRALISTPPFRPSISGARSPGSSKALPPGHHQWALGTAPGSVALTAPRGPWGRAAQYCSRLRGRDLLA